MSSLHSYSLPTSSTLSTNITCVGSQRPPCISTLTTPTRSKPHAESIPSHSSKKDTSIASLRSFAANSSPLHESHICPYVDCGKSFSKKYNLKAHLRLHTGELPFICDRPNCKKKFKWRSSLSSHAIWHSRKESSPNSDNLSKAVSNISNVADNNKSVSSVTNLNPPTLKPSDNSDGSHTSNYGGNNIPLASSCLQSQSQLQREKHSVVSNNNLPQDDSITLSSLVNYRSTIDHKKTIVSPSNTFSYETGNNGSSKSSITVCYDSGKRRRPPSNKNNRPIPPYSSPNGYVLSSSLKDIFNNSKACINEKSWINQPHSQSVSGSISSQEYREVKKRKKMSDIKVIEFPGFLTPTTHSLDTSGRPFLDVSMISSDTLPSLQSKQNESLHGVPNRLLPLSRNTLPVGRDPNHCSDMPERVANSPIYSAFQETEIAGVTSRSETVSTGSDISFSSFQYGRSTPNIPASLHSSSKRLNDQVISPYINCPSTDATALFNLPCSPTFPSREESERDQNDKGPYEFSSNGTGISAHIYPIVQPSEVVEDGFFASLPIDCLSEFEVDSLNISDDRAM